MAYTVHVFRYLARQAACLLLGCGLATLCSAADVAVAVASNFSAPMQRIAAVFARDTGHRAVLSFGSTGKLYAQISNGAPFQVLLAADQETPARLEQDKRTVAGTRFTYAVGRLALWSKDATLVDAQGAVLRRGTWSRIALADPRLAPYGAAAMDVLGRMGLRETVQSKLVQAESIGMAYQFVRSGNAALGFVALSQVMTEGAVREGSAWMVPATLHRPLRQDAVALAGSQSNPAAAALLAYLQGPEARAVMRGYGYGFDQP